MSSGATGRRPGILTRGSLVQRFFLVFLGAIGLPVAAIGVLFTVIYQRFSLDLASKRAAEALEPLAQGIDEEVRRAALLAATLSTDLQFVDTVVELNQGRGPRERYEASARIDARLSAFFNYTNKTGAVLLYLRDRPVYLYRNNGLLFERPLERGVWYERVVRTPDATRIIGDLDSYSLDPSPRPLLKIAVCPSRDSLARGFQALVVAFRVPFLDRVSAEPGDTSDEELLLLDGDGTVLLGHTPKPQGSPADASLLSPTSFRRDGSTYVVHPAPIPSAGWTLVSVTDLSRLTRDVEIPSRLARALLLVLLGAFVVYIEVFFRQVIWPIRHIIGEMGKVEQGDWSARAPAGGPAEIAHLGRSFNTMVSEIGRLSAERESQERARARLELESLRLQMNPHFLTNTLNSIKMMAAISNAEPIRRMTAALMRVVSSALRDGDALATVGAELDLLEEYLLIMRVRYGDTFDVRRDVPPEHRSLRILRMVLQPLVENAILHGLQGLDVRGEIVIQSTLQAGPEVLTLEVRDNGRGADAERVSRALEDPPERHRGMTSIGLTNIRRRIALNHGPPFGLIVLCPPHGGTTVRLRLPVVRGE